MARPVAAAAMGARGGAALAARGGAIRAFERKRFEWTAFIPKASKPLAAVQAWAQAKMARVLAELEEAQAEARLRLRLAEAADEEDEALTDPSARTPRPGTSCGPPGRPGNGAVGVE